MNWINFIKIKTMDNIIIGYLIIWTVTAFLVAYLGKEKEIGYWSTFTISLLLSPIVAIIVAILSKQILVGSSNDANGKHRFKTKLDEAKKAEYKGQIEASIDLYMDTLYYLENDYKNMKGEFEMKRLDLIIELKSKVEELKSKI